jgi:Zn-dependent protease
MTCLQCGTEIPPNLLACPACHALVHAAELKKAAANAEEATAIGDVQKALQHWRAALALLPPGSQQHGVISRKINDLVTHVDATELKPSKKPAWASGGGVLGAIGLLFWKFKFILVFILTKGKLLLLGLTKGGTLFSMFLSFGLYWTVFGWQFAAGLIVSIYIHEMGHVYQLTRYGIKATAPMFIPGLGAVIRQKQYPASPHEGARVGLAGPIWGLGAAGASYAIFLFTGWPIFAPIGKFGAWINLFNLLPVWQLDGSHAFKALTRLERGIIGATMFTMAFVTETGLLGLLGVVAGFRAFQKSAPKERDTAILVEFLFLIVTLALLSTIPDQTP